MLPDMHRPCNTHLGDDYDLSNPNGKITMGVMYIYSMEPPFYSRLNEVCRECNDNMKDNRRQFEEDLKHFGAYASALHSALNAERQREDKLPTGIEFYDIPKGIDNSNGLGFFNQSFLLYRGVNLHKDQF